MHGARARERPEVSVAQVVRGARGEDTRVLVAQSNHDVRVALVVSKGGVEARTVALDQVGLQHERLRLRPGRDEVYLPDAPPELSYLRTPVARAGKVIGNAAADVLGFSDVEHRAPGILEDVDT